MGLERTITFPGEGPAWPAVAALLAARGAPVQMRMIDGDLAAPDEEPPEAWRELRVALAGEMATVRREAAAVRLVVWGNPGPGQRQLWDALSWAFAATGGGAVQTDAGPLSAEAFAAGAEFPPGWKP